MKIISLELHKVDIKDSRIRAIEKIEFSNGLIINDIRVLEGDDGLFIAMPIPRNIDRDEFLKVINEEVRVMIEEAIINKYKEL